MHIVSFSAKNILRLKAVEFEPDGTWVEITGRNAEGKSSVLTACCMALLGKDYQPARPVRNGAEHGEVRVELSDGKVVILKVRADGARTLKIEQNGATLKTPQQVLDAIFSHLSFRPMEFLRLPAKQQAEVLRALAGVDLSKIDEARQKLYDERRDLNRDLAQAEAQLKSMPSEFPPDLAEVDVSDLLTQRRAREDEISRYRAMEREFDALGKELQDCDRDIEEARAKLAELEEERKTTHAKWDLQREKMRTAQCPVTADLDAKIAGASKTNDLVRQRKARTDVEARVQDLTRASDDLTAKIGKCDEYKAQAIERAKLPVAGLSFTADGVTFNGLPLDQASTAEKVAITAAIGHAHNVNARIMFVEQGNDLDSAHREALKQYAEDNELQIWIERATDGEPVGFVIEDGQLKEEPVGV